MASWHSCVFRTASKNGVRDLAYWVLCGVDYTNVEGGTRAEGIGEQSAEEDNEVQQGQGNRGLEKTT